MCNGPTTGPLTGADRDTMARAVALADLRGAAIREHTRERDLGMAMAAAFGEAQHLLAELVAIIGRLTGGARPGGIAHDG